MYYALSAMTGVILSVMVMLNGMLSNHSGIYTSSVIIHVTGLIAITIMVSFKKEIRKLFTDRLPLYLYTGGIVGVLTIVFNNMAFSKIDLSAILALSLLGQSTTSLIIDHFGLFGMKQIRFSPKKLIGIISVLTGIICMISFKDFNQFVPIFVSFLSGISIVVARTINGKLAVEKNVRISTWFNNFTGSVVTILILIGLKQTGLNEPPFALTANPITYTGGVIGMGVVFVSSICVSKISSFYMTLLIFGGQIFTGIVIDIIMSQSFSIRNLIGGIIITLGLAADMYVNAGYRKNKIQS